MKTIMMASLQLQEVSSRPNERQWTTLTQEERLKAVIARHLEDLTAQYIEATNNRDWDHAIWSMMARSMRTTIEHPGLQSRVTGPEAHLAIVKQIFDDDSTTQIIPGTIRATVHDPTVAPDGIGRWRANREPSFAEVWLVLSVTGVHPGISRENVTVIYWSRAGNNSRSPVSELLQSTLAVVQVFADKNGY